MTIAIRGEPNAMPVTIRWPQDDTSCPHIDRLWLHVLATFLAADPGTNDVLIHRRLYVTLRGLHRERTVAHDQDRYVGLGRSLETV